MAFRLSSRLTIDLPTILTTWPRAVIWILAVSTVSYLNLLDLGLRSAVIRFVSKAQAQNNLDEARNVVSATLWIRSLLAAGVAVLSNALAFTFPHFFRFLVYAVWAMAYLEYFLFLRLAVLWNNRQKPSVSGSLLSLPLVDYLP